MNVNINTYRLISDAEPTDEELSMLMHEVALEAQDRSLKAHAALRENVHNEIKAAMGGMLAPEQREEIGTLAADTVRRLGYVGAGTVEFLLKSTD